VAPEADADQGHSYERCRNNHHDLRKRTSVLGRLSSGSFGSIGRVNRAFGVIEHLLHPREVVLGFRDLLASHVLQELPSLAVP
jgi:hypothetical protein